MKELNLRNYIGNKDAVKGGYLIIMEIKTVDNDGIHYFNYHKGFNTLKSAQKHFRQLVKSGLEFSALYLARRGDERILDSHFNS